MASIPSDPSEGGALHFHKNVVGIVLDGGRSLRTEKIRAMVEILANEGKARITDPAVEIDNAAFVRLDSEQLGILDAPLRLPFRIHVREVGDLTQPGLTYEFEVRDGDGRHVGVTRREGVTVIIGAGRYLLHPGQYELLREIDEVNAVDWSESLSRSDVLQRQLRPLLRIQEAAREGGVNLSEYLAGQEIVFPTAVQPRIDFLPDGGIEVRPLLGSAPPPSDESDRDREFTAALSPEENAAFERSLRLRRDRIGGHHVVGRSIGGRKHVILNDGMQDALKELEGVRRLDAAEAQHFLNNPHEFLTGKCFALDDFSERVVELAELRFISNMTLTPRALSFDWEKLLLRLGGPDDAAGETPLDVSTPADFVQLEASYQRAVEKERKHFVFKGNIFPTDDPRIPEILRGTRAVMTMDGLLPGDRAAAAEMARRMGLAEKSPSIGLKIKDNLDELSMEIEETPEFRPGQLALPGALKPEVNLYEYQLEGYSWLCGLADGGHPGGLLADDMGLGKTLQILAFLVKQLESGVQEPILVVAPVTLLDTWSGELFNRFLAPYGDRCLIAHHEFLSRYQTRGAVVRQRTGEEVTLRNKRVLSEEGTRRLRMAQIVITNYETIRSHQLSFGEIKFRVIVCDEAQKIKNPTTHVTNALKAMNADYRIASTATPVENSLVDLWSIVDFLAPGYLGSLKEFKERYVPTAARTVDPERVGELRRRLDERKLILRRTKKDMLKDLPEKHEHHVEVPLGPKQVGLYRNFVQIATEDPQSVLSVLSRLIAVSSHPAACLGGDLRTAAAPQLIADCPKLSWTMDRLAEIQERGEKALVFSRFRRIQEILSTCIQHRFGPQYAPEIINGQTPPIRRQGIVDAFNRRPGFGVLVLSPEAAGFGLNITGANHVIHYSRLWNPAKEDQATDRVYRIGQTREVHVYYPIASFPPADGADDKTIEQQIHELLAIKRGMMREFLVPSEALTISPDELWAALNRRRPEPQAPEVGGAVELDALSHEQFILLMQVFCEKDGYLVQRPPRTGNLGVDLVVHDQGDSGGMLVACDPGAGASERGTLVKHLAEARRSYEREHRREFPKLFFTTRAPADRLFEKLCDDLGVTCLGRGDLEAIVEEKGISMADILRLWHDREIDEPDREVS